MQNPPLFCERVDIGDNRLENIVFVDTTNRPYEIIDLAQRPETRSSRHPDLSSNLYCAGQDLSDYSPNHLECLSSLHGEPVGQGKPCIDAVEHTRSVERTGTYSLVMFSPSLSEKCCISRIFSFAPGRISSWNVDRGPPGTYVSSFVKHSVQ